MCRFLFSLFKLNNKLVHLFYDDFESTNNGRQLGVMILHPSNMKNPFDPNLFFVAAISERKEDAQIYFKFLLDLLKPLHNSDPHIFFFSLTPISKGDYVEIYSSALGKKIKVRFWLAMTEGDNVAQCYAHCILGSNSRSDYSFFFKGLKQSGGGKNPAREPNRYCLRKKTSSFLLCLDGYPHCTPHNLQETAIKLQDLRKWNEMGSITKEVLKEEMRNLGVSQLHLVSESHHCSFLLVRAICWPDWI